MIKLLGWLAYNGRQRATSLLLRTMLWRWRVCDEERQALKHRVRELERVLEDMAKHDWQHIGSKGHRYTLEALAELIDNAKAVTKEEA